MGGPGGVAAHQHLRLIGVAGLIGVGLPRWGQRGQGLLQDNDVIAGGVGTGVAGANSPPRASPPAISGRSKNASSGWWPNVFFQVGVAPALLSE